MRVDGHDHAHHQHGVAPDADRGRLAAALALILAFMAAEVVAGFVAGSLALLSDAAHMVTDAASLAMALVAARLAARPPSAAYTFGLGRAEILSGQANGATLLVLAGVIAVEAVQRLRHPADVDGAVVVAVGLLGAAVNVAVAWQLARAERRSLNIEGARAHVLTDLYASLSAAVAGGLILTTGFRAADGLAALIVAALMVRSGWRLLRDAARVLLEGSPAGVASEEVGRALAAHPGVVEVHDLHVWEVTSGFPALAAHVLVVPGDDCHARRRELDRLVHDRFGIDHTTLQVDHAAEERLLEIEGTGAGPHPSPGPGVRPARKTP
jgi:cobalt-zinc-cadmium efflux system protein